MGDSNCFGVVRSNGLKKRDKMGRGFAKAAARWWLERKRKKKKVALDPTLVPRMNMYNIR